MDSKNADTAQFYKSYIKELKMVKQHLIMILKIKNRSSKDILEKAKIYYLTLCRFKKQASTENIIENTHCIKQKLNYRDL